MANSSSGVIQPTMHDILLGRGKTYHNHRGNQRFRAIIAVHIPKYADNQTTRKQKTKIVQSIVQDMYKDGCRFLNKNGKQPDSVWYDVGIQSAKKKVGHALRDATAEMNRTLKRAEHIQSRQRRRSLSRQTSRSTILDRAAFDSEPDESKSAILECLPDTINSVDLSWRASNTTTVSRANNRKKTDCNSSSDDSCDSSGLFPTSELFKYADIEPISIENFSTVLVSQQQPRRLSAPLANLHLEHNSSSADGADTAEQRNSWTMASSTNIFQMEEDEGDFFSSLLGMLNRASSVMDMPDGSAGPAEEARQINTSSKVKE